MKKEYDKRKRNSQCKVWLVQKEKYSKRSIRERQKEGFVSRMQDQEEAAIVGLESNSTVRLQVNFALKSSI